MTGGLTCQIQGEHSEEETKSKTFDVVGIENNMVSVMTLKTVSDQYHLEDIFPVLRPFSDLFKPIFDEEKTPIELLEKLFKTQESSLKYEETENGICFFFENAETNFRQSVPFEFYEKLFEWNIDIYDLIFHNLAIYKDFVNSSLSVA